jgi:hypothetical protein
MTSQELQSTLVLRIFVDLFSSRPDQKSPGYSHRAFYGSVFWVVTSIFGFCVGGCWSLLSVIGQGSYRGRLSGEFTEGNLGLAGELIPRLLFS